MSGALLQMTFDKAMKNPVGKHNQFTVEKEIVTEPPTYTDWVTVPDSPQKTSDYPYQVVITDSSGYKNLICSKSKIFLAGTNPNQFGCTGYYMYSMWAGNWVAGANDSGYSSTSFGYSSVVDEANHPIYTDVNLNTVYFAQTTPILPTSVELTPTLISLNANPNILDLYIQEAIAYGDVVRVDYTKGTIESADGAKLDSFTDATVINTEVPPPLYQPWASGILDSPFLTTDYPYQIICNDGTATYVFGCASKMWWLGDNFLRFDNPSAYTMKKYHNNTHWDAVTSGSSGSVAMAGVTILQANHPVYSNSDKTDVFFAKTTI